MKMLLLCPIADAGLAERLAALIAVATQQLRVQPLAWDQQHDPPSHYGYVLEIEAVDVGSIAREVSDRGCTLLEVVAHIGPTLAAVGLEVIGDGDQGNREEVDSTTE